MLRFSEQESTASITKRSFFFFQAEDGIRDLTVTGVQTCALPISGYSAWTNNFYPAYFDYTIIKYSSQGLPLWTNRYNGPGNGADYPTDLALDNSGKDRKSTRLNSSHSQISYAVFCLKKRKHPNPLRSSDLQQKFARSVGRARTRLRLPESGTARLGPSTSHCSCPCNDTFRRRSAY